MPWQVTAEQCLHRRSSYTQRQIWLSLLCRSLLHSLGPVAQNELFVPSKSHWWVCDLILNMIAPLLLSCLDFSLPLEWGIFFWWDPTLFSQLLFSVRCNFGVFTEEDEHKSFYSTILFISTVNIVETNKNKEFIPV